jgi:hypothetical protein
MRNPYNHPPLVDAFNKGANGQSAYGQGLGQTERQAYAEGQATNNRAPVDYSTPNFVSVGSGGDAFGLIKAIVMIIFVVGMIGYTFNSLKKYISSQTAVNRDATTLPTTHNTASFDEGAIDRGNWEAWFAGLSGEARDGAFYWSGARSNADPGSCYAGEGRTSPAYSSACIGAQKFFATVDARRKTDRDYWCGWNSPERLCSQ